MLVRLKATLALCLFSAVLGETLYGQRFSVSVHDSDPEDCNALEVTAHGREIARSEERIELAGLSVDVAASRNGGIWITGSKDSGYSVLACKVAVAEDRAQAEAALARIAVRRDGSRVRVESSGPEPSVVYFLVRAPRGATMTAHAVNGPIQVRQAQGSFTLSTENGPVAIDHSTGQFEARAQNGPVSVTNSSGQIRAETVNGPISASGNAGDLCLRAQNGPLAVTLEGTEWRDGALEGRSENGPLTLVLPAGYRSGVIVEAIGTPPFECSGCERARRTWDERARRVEFGSAPLRVRLTTVNGPVSVRTRGE